MVSVIKRSGDREGFDPDKVKSSLLRSGAEKKVVDEVVKKVKARVYDGITTARLYRLAYRLLREYDRCSAKRFCLKEAIMRLGPTGYPFERYVARVLDELGYETEINLLLKGVKVVHEVDVCAEKDGLRYMIECKYRNMPGYTTGLKEALYTRARFCDLLEGGNKFSNPWIFCNTKITGTAIRYGEHLGMKFTSWGYPSGKNLQDMIECQSMYPVTILKSVTQKMKCELAKKDIIFAYDLLDLDKKQLSKAVGKPIEKIRPVVRELDELLGMKKGQKCR